MHLQPIYPNLMMKIKNLATLGLVAVMAGCATAPEHVSAEAGKRIRKVGIVSLIGDEFTRSYVGMTVFGNEYHRRDIVEWGLDREYETQLANAVRELPAMTAVTANIDRPAFAKLDIRSNPPAWEGIEQAVTQHCAANGLDGILVLAKVGGRGVGVSVSRQHSFRALHVSAQLALYDCSTGKVAASNWLVAGPPKGAFGNKVQIPSLELPESWPVDGEWQAGTYEEAHAQLIMLPRPAWGYTLRQLLISM